MLEQAPNKAKTTVLLLPFSVSGKNRTLPFSEEMETAAIFIMAESDRKKGEGLILKKPAEGLTFVAKSCYPVWLVPWNGKTLLFDGLGVTSRIMLYEVLPDVKSVINDIEGSASILQAYEAALQDHLHYFESIKRVEEKPFLGLITNSEFLEDFQQFMNEAEETEQPDVKDVCLSPSVEEATISSSLRELSELHATLESDIRILREAMRSTNTATKQHVETIREEIRNVQSDLGEKIAGAKSVAMDAVRQIQGKYDTRILKTSQRFDRQLQDLQQDRVKLEKTEERAISKIERAETEIQTAKMGKDSLAQKRWKDEREMQKREASTVRKSIEALDKQIGQAESQKKIEVANIRAGFDAESEEAMKGVRELEAQRDSKVQLSQQKIKSLEDWTSAILGQLDVLTKKKRATLEELSIIGMKEQRRKTALAYVPIYVACFRAGAKRRYLVYSPSVAGSMKTTTKLKGMLGMSKLKSLFQPRSKALANIMSQVTVLADRDPVFEKDLYDAGVQASKLKAESVERITKGLTDLRNEEWISVNEAQAFTALLKTSH